MIRTVAGRWRKIVEEMSLDKVLSREDMARAMMTFYAGFGACLEAQLEIAELSELEAVLALTQLHAEVKTISDAAAKISTNGMTSQ